MQTSSLVPTSLVCQVGQLDSGELKNLKRLSNSIEDGAAIIEFDEVTLVEGLEALATFNNGQLLLAFEIREQGISSEVLSDGTAANLTIEFDSKKFRLDCETKLGTGSIPEGIAPPAGTGTGSIPEGIAPPAGTGTGSIPEGIAPAKR